MVLLVLLGCAGGQSFIIESELTRLRLSKLDALPAREFESPEGSPRDTYLISFPSYGLRPLIRPSYGLRPLIRRVP